MREAGILNNKNLILQFKLTIFFPVFTGIYTLWPILFIFGVFKQIYYFLMLIFFVRLDLTAMTYIY